MKVHAIILASLVVGALGNAVAASPGSPVTQNLNVSATVNNVCTLTTTSVAFGAYDPVTANAAADLNNGTTGKLTVTCTKSAAGVTMTLGNGLHFTTVRNMSDGTDALSYELYQPSSAAPAAACTFPGTTVWNVANPLSPAAASFDGTAKDFLVCGTIPQAQNVGAGSYSDTVVATVNF